MTELVAYERRQIESPRAISLESRPIMPMDSHEETWGRKPERAGRTRNRRHRSNQPSRRHDRPVSCMVGWRVGPAELGAWTYDAITVGPAPTQDPLEIWLGGNGP